MHYAICPVNIVMDYEQQTEIPEEGTESEEQKSVSPPPEESPDQMNRLSSDDDEGNEIEGKEDEEDPLCDLSFTSSNDDETEPSSFEEIKENIYLVDRKKSRTIKEARRMKCDCVFDPEDPFFVGCGETCLNRLLMIECTSRCRCGEFCTNKNFQRGTKYKLEVFKTEKKGFGLRTLEDIPKGSFVIEYCGEIVDYSEFMDRTELYEAEGRKHYYFMTLKTNEVIDATKKGARSRFINHSCDPNCETQKWTVYGFLRIGFFSIKDIEAGQELSFDYQFERYGEKAQKCYCGSSNCRGVIGGEKQTKIKTNFYDRVCIKKRRRKKEEDEELIEEALDGELSELLGEQGEIVNGDQMLELTRLMVKVERFQQRLRLLKVLQCCNDSFALKSFVRYNGLSLLWSWMVDATNESTEYKIEIMNTLQHVPIPNMNQLKDSKILQIVQKWAKLNGPVALQKSSPDGEEDGSSNSDAENEAKNGSDSGSQNGETLDESIVETDGSPEETGSKDSDDTKDDDSKDSTDKKETKKKKDAVAAFACSLLDDWKSLKEIFKIPKKSQMTPDKKSKVGSDGECSASPAEDRRNNKKRAEGRGEDKPSKTYSPSVARGDSPSGMLSDSSPSVTGGMSPVLPILSPMRGAQSKALASNLESINRNTDTDNGRLRDMNSADNNTANKGDNQDGDGELWNDLFRITDASNSDGGNPDLVHDDADIDQDYGESGHKKRWSRWGDDDNRRGARFAGSKHMKKKRRRGSYNWFYENYQYPGGRSGRMVPRGQKGAHDNDDEYSNEYGNEYENDYGSERKYEYETERNYRGGHHGRHKGNFSMRSSSSMDNYRGPGYHKRGYSGIQGTGVNHTSRVSTMQQNMLPRPTVPVEPSPAGTSIMPNRLPVPISSQMSDVRPITVITQQRSGWQNTQRPISGNPGNPLPPPLMPPHLQGQPPPPQQTYNQQMPPAVPSNPPCAPVLQHPVPPPPAQLQPPANPVLGNCGRFGVSGPTTPSVSTAPIVPLPTSSRPPIQDCPPQAPPPRLPPFQIQPPPRFIRQQLPVSPAQAPSGTGISLPNPPPSLLAPRFPAPTPLTMGQLPTSLPLQQPPTESLLSPTVSFSQGPTAAPPIDVSKLQALMHINTSNIVPAVDLPNPQLSSPPHVQNRSSVASSTQILSSPLNDPQAESSPVSSKPIPALPQNWKTATDPEGKIYYYHTVTRQTQWDPPTWDDDGPKNMDIDEKDYSVISGPRTPSLSPPHSPITPSDRAGSVMAAADTTVNRHKNASGHHSHRSSSTEHLTPRSQKIRDAFKTKLSAVVVNCLNPYQKVDCKQGKITRTEDFKFLARKLTHGLMVKEMARVKEGALECNDSVKIKVKEYIRNYMKKFGDVYVRS